MRVDIVSDVICPWCYIGKRRLEKALALRPGVSIDTSWRPFQLNPDMPAEGIDRRAYLAAKFGGSAHAERIYANVTEAGVSVGGNFSVIGFDDIEEAKHTLPALTTVAVNGRDLGSRAAQLLMRHLASGDFAPEAVLCPTTLMIRQSCGAANPGH